MAEAFTHYVKFARSLAMTSTVAILGCSGAADPTGDPEPAASTTSAATTTTTSTSPQATSTGEGGAGGSAPVVADAGTPPPDVDAGHISGPLPPPELPGSL